MGSEKKAEQGKFRESLHLGLFRGGQRQSREEALDANDTQAMRGGGFFPVSSESWHH